ncbi:MAG: hypothetical protein V4760_01310 [Bdellovibrionota bacterium]
MKSSFVVVLVFLLSSFAFASTTRENAKPELLVQLPAAIKCTSAGFSPTVKAFEIVGLDTVKPDATFDDQGLVDPPAIVSGPYAKDRFRVSFSNECDNGYDLEFFVEQLIALKNGTAKTIHGILEYNDVEVFYETEELTPDEKVVVTCTL